MKNTLSFFFYLFCCFGFFIFQTKVIPESSLGKFTPDLNLILVICLAVETGTSYLFVLAALNGWFIDASVGNTVGIHTLTRLAIFLIIRIGIRNIRLSDNSPLSLPIMLSSGTLLVFLFKMLAEQYGQVDYPYLNLELFVYQVVINTVVGVPTIKILKKINVFIKK